MRLNLHAARSALRYLPQARRDAHENRRCASERILAMRYAGRSTTTIGALLDWLERRFPDVRSRFEMRLFPTRIRDWSPYRLHLPWLQDPVQRWSQRVYRMALRVAEQCEAHGIPIVNPVDRMTNASKSEGSTRVAGAGVRTARTVRVKDRTHLLSLPTPLIVREDWLHGGPHDLARSTGQLEAVRLSRYRRPVAVEFIDARSPDGLYRKYRSLVAGQEVVPVHLHMTRHWRTKGGGNVKGGQYREEELAFTGGPDPNAERLIRAREAIGLDMVGFDYGYDTAGALVVWEANVLPSLHFSTGYRSYRAPAIERALAAMTRLYLRRAGFAIPDELELLRCAQSSSCNRS